MTTCYLSTINCCYYYLLFRHAGVVASSPSSRVDDVVAAASNCYDHSTCQPSESCSSTSPALRPRLPVSVFVSQSITNRCASRCRFQRQNHLHGGITSVRHPAATTMRLYDDCRCAVATTPGERRSS